MSERLDFVKSNKNETAADDRIVTSHLRQEDITTEVNFRPQTLEEYIGQEHFHQGCCQPRRRFGSYFALRTAGVGQNHPCQYHSQ